jgi:hypothetical protein
MMHDIHGKLNTGLHCQSSIQKEGLFHRQTGLKSKEETTKVLSLLLLCIVLKLGHVGK